MLGRVKQQRPEKSILLTGLRGVGKTVLLNEMERLALADGYRTILIEAHENKSLGIRVACCGGPNRNSKTLAVVARRYVDGCDGGSDARPDFNDWVVDCQAQGRIVSLLDRIDTNLANEG